VGGSSDLGLQLVRNFRFVERFRPDAAKKEYFGLFSLQKIGPVSIREIGPTRIAYEYSLITPHTCELTAGHGTCAPVQPRSTSKLKSCKETELHGLYRVLQFSFPNKYWKVNRCTEIPTYLHIQCFKIVVHNRFQVRLIFTQKYTKCIFCLIYASTPAKGPLWQLWVPTLPANPRVGRRRGCMHPIGTEFINVLRSQLTVLTDKHLDNFQLKYTDH